MWDEAAREGDGAPLLLTLIARLVLVKDGGSGGDDEGRSGRQSELRESGRLEPKVFCSDDGSGGGEGIGRGGVRDLSSGILNVTGGLLGGLIGFGALCGVAVTAAVVCTGGGTSCLSPLLVNVLPELSRIVGLYGFCG